MLADLLVIAWLALCTMAGLAVHALLSGVAAPLRRVGEVGRDFDASMSEVAETASDVPVVGDRLEVPFLDAAAAGQRLRDAGGEGAALIDSLALTLGVLLALLPALLVLVPWLLVRVRFARRAAAARRLADDPTGRDLLALRALLTQPAATLRATVREPVAGWRTGDPDVSRRLAALELARLGLRG